MSIDVIDFQIFGNEIQYVGKIKTAMFGGEGLFCPN